MPDQFSNVPPSLVSSATKGYAITPNDDTDVAQVTRAIYVGTGGDLTVILADDSNPVTFKNVPGGTMLPIRVDRVRATATTASNLLGLY